MKCPRCDCVLCTVDYEGVRVETCPECKGEWLDAGELRPIVKTLEREFTEEQRASLRAVNESFFREQQEELPPSGMNCPKCGDAELQPYVYAATTDVELDKCPACGGVWLDDAELEKVQMLAEEWDKRAEDDIQNYRELMAKLDTRSEAADVRQTGPSRWFPFINRFLAWISD